MSLLRMAPEQCEMNFVRHLGIELKRIFLFCLLGVLAIFFMIGVKCWICFSIGSLHLHSLLCGMVDGRRETVLGVIEQFHI